MATTDMVTTNMLWIWIFFMVVSANTETYLLTIPKYYEVPFCEVISTDLIPTHVHMKEKGGAINHFPILNVSTINQVPSIRISPSQKFTENDKGTIFVKLNNYYNSTFDSNDLLFIKLCWPAIYPVGFDLGHEFMTIDSPNLDIYLRIAYHFDYQTTGELVDSIEFNLMIEKLPVRIPIPIEVYDTIVYQVNIVIILVAILYVYTR